MRIVFSLSLALLSTGIFAQTESWSLERCISHAAENNVFIKQQVLARERQRVNLEQSKANQYPSLNSSIGHIYNFGRAIDPFTNQFVNQSIQSNNFSLSSSVTLYNGGRIKNDIRFRTESVDRAQLDVDVLKINTAQDVAVAYLNVLMAEQSLNTAIQQDSSSSAQLERVKRLVEGGRLSKSDRLILEAQRATDKLNIRQAESTLQSSYLALQQLLQLDPREVFQIEIPNIEVGDFLSVDDMDEVIEKSLNEVPEVLVAKQLIELNRINKDVAKASALPQLNLFANLNTVYSQSRKEAFNETLESIEIGYVDGSGTPVFRDAYSFETRTSPFGSQLSDNFGQSVGLNLRIPIYNNRQVRTQVDLADIGVTEAEMNLLIVKNTIRATVTDRYLSMANAQLSYLAAIENEEAQKQSYIFSEKRYNNGMITSAELILTQNNWRTSVEDLERAKFNLLFANAYVRYFKTGIISLQ